MLRIPLLYGKVEKLVESGVTALLTEILAKDVPRLSSDYEVRHPMHTEDVADAIHVLATSKLQVRIQIARYRLNFYPSTNFGLESIAPTINLVKWYIQQNRRNTKHKYIILVHVSGVT